MSAPSQASQQRELVFCHACENEWYRDEHGLVCPSCHGEFTEIIEQDHDPRAPDPDEDDIEDFTHDGDGRARPEHFPPNIFSAVGNLFGAALGGPGNNSETHNPMADGPRETRSQPGSRQTSGPSPTGPTVHVSFNSGPGYSFTSRTSTYVSGGAAGQDHFGGGAQPEFGRMLIDILGTINGSRGHFHGAPGPDGFPRGFGPGGMMMGSGAGGPGGGLNDLFAQMMGGIHGNPGDYITNQEAFDRMMTQFMDEHASGSAPGPASAEAIASLKRMPADRATLGGDKADCSICMDEVTEGQQIIKLPCSHWYHPDCITLWLKEHDTCAICRKGIMPESGDSSTARQPTEAPMNNHDPAEIVRRESGTRDDPIWVPESPSQARRTRPGSSSHSSSSDGSSRRAGQGNEGGGFARSFRNMFSGSSSMGGGAGGGGAHGQPGRDGPPRR